jgi:UDP-glucuronate decarboxylase
MQELDWRPKIDLSSGLRQTIDYFDGVLTRPARELEAV